jgi:hypothetical protein
LGRRCKKRGRNTRDLLMGISGRKKEEKKSARKEESLLNKEGGWKQDWVGNPSGCSSALRRS